MKTAQVSMAVPVLLMRSAVVVTLAAAVTLAAVVTLTVVVTVAHELL